MSELIRNLVDDARWADALPYPEVIGAGELYMDRAVGQRTSNTLHAWVSVPNKAVKRLEKGEEFPDLDQQGPLLQVTLDTFAAGPSHMIDGLVGGKVRFADNKDHFERLTLETLDPLHMKRTLCLALAHPLGAAVVMRSTSYVVQAGDPEGRFVGLRGDELTTRIEEEVSFDEWGAMTGGETEFTTWRGNIVLPRLVVGRRYVVSERCQDDPESITERLQVVAAHEFWTPEPLHVDETPPSPVGHIPQPRKGD